MARSIRTPAIQQTRALRRFLATEAAGGVVLVVAAAIAMAWANSPWSASYEEFWHTPILLEAGSLHLELDLRHWVNDGLMAIFFLVVGLEIKRELFEGELRDPRKAALPVVAAVGGMVVPAGIFVALNAGRAGADGWAIPMATDIAFALGVAALVGRGLPGSLRLFLLTLAIVDDIGAIVVLAIFYADDLSWAWLVAAFGFLALAYVFRQAGVVATPVFVAMGVGLWLSLHESGVHATLAGVAMGLLAPVRPVLTREIVESRADEMLDVFSPSGARTTSRLARLSVSEVEWLEHALHPWTSLFVVPVFALANAGVAVPASAVDDALGSPVTWGVILGLVVGKTVGISLFAWLATVTRVGTLPREATWAQLVGVAALAGIGFTVSLFIAGLAYDDAGLVDQAKLGILASAVVATALGSAILLTIGRGRPTGDAPADPQPEPAAAH